MRFHLLLLLFLLLPPLVNWVTRNEFLAFIQIAGHNEDVFPGLAT